MQKYLIILDRPYAPREERDKGPCATYAWEETKLRDQVEALKHLLARDVFYPYGGRWGDAMVGERQGPDGESRCEAMLWVETTPAGAEKIRNMDGVYNILESLQGCSLPPRLQTKIPILTISKT